MGQVPSKVSSGNASGDRYSYKKLPLRTHSSLSVYNSTDQNDANSPPNYFRKIYRKRSIQELRQAAVASSWFGLGGSQNALNETSTCRRCDALIQLAIDKDIIVDSLETMIADMRMKMAACDNELLTAKAHECDKRQELALKLYEANKKIADLEKLCAANSKFHFDTFGCIF